MRRVLRCGLRRGKVGSFALLLGLAAVGWAQQAGLPDAPLAETAVAQQGKEAAQRTSIHGVVVNKDGAVYEGAHVALTQHDTSAARTVTTDSNGRFDFFDLTPGSFTLTVSSIGFATQVVSGTVRVGESFEAKAIVLAMSGTTSQVEVTATPEEIATEELREEETQRVLGIIPNFYVTYVPDAPHLTTRQKFGLAWKSSIDPVTLLTVGAFAGQEQAQNTFSGYGQGAQGYGKRYGAAFGDEFIASMIGGAILPSWWKQDPRYFYKGTGTTRSRTMYALKSAVMCKGDNGRWQVNYSAIVGGLAAGGISNLYYPADSRDGAGLTFANALVGTATSAAENLFQEFLVRKLTPHVPNYGVNKP